VTHDVHGHHFPSLGESLASVVGVDDVEGGDDAGRSDGAFDSYDRSRRLLATATAAKPAMTAISMSTDGANVPGRSAAKLTQAAATTPRTRSRRRRIKSHYVVELRQRQLAAIEAARKARESESWAFKATHTTDGVLRAAYLARAFGEEDDDQ